MTKKLYTKPHLTIYGNVEVLTKAGSNGNALDKDFTAGTPRGELTFS